MDYKQDKKIYEIRNLKKSLTEEQLLDMIRFDWENASTIPDSSSYKMKFIKEMQLVYGELGVEEQYQAWKEKEEDLKTRFPTIHGETDE